MSVLIPLGPMCFSYRSSTLKTELIQDQLILFSKQADNTLPHSLRMRFLLGQISVSCKRKQGYLSG